MSLVASITMPSPNIVQQNQEVRILVNLQAIGTDETVQGIEVWDVNGVFKVGDLQKFDPNTYDAYTGGTPVISQIPYWGNEAQASYTNPILGSSVPLIYPVQNLNPAPTWIETTYNGGFGSTLSANPLGFMPITISSGVVAQYIVSLVSNQANGIQGSKDYNFQVGNIQVRATSTDNTGVTNFYQTPGPNALYVVSKVITGIQVFPIGVGTNINRNDFGRPANYSNFDIAMGTALVYADDSVEDISSWDITNNYVSGTPGTATIVATGPYLSTAPASIPNAYNAVPTYPVGSIPPGGWLGTKLTGGAGALTIVAFPLGAGDGSPNTTTITNTIGAFSASVQMNFRNQNAIGAFISPPVYQLTYLPAAVGRNTVDLSSFIIWNDGTTSANRDTGTVTYTSLDTSVATVVAGTGVVSQVQNVNAEVPIRCVISYAGGSRTITAWAKVICTLNTNYAAFATA